MAYQSRQRVYGGGKFKSERQRRAIWAASPTLGHLWAHNASARGHRSQWAKVGRGAATHTGKLSAPRASIGFGGSFSARPARRARTGRSMGTKGHARSGSFKR